MTKATRFTFAVAAFCILLRAGEARAQDEAGERRTTRIEIGAHYSLLRFDDFTQTPAVGARATYNVTDHLSVEAEADIFPFEVLSGGYVEGGRSLQAQLGVKAGKRFRRFGVFAKARPGLVSFSETATPVITGSFIGFDGREFFTVDFVEERKTHLSMDVGGVVEFYPSRRLIARFDVGDTMLRYGRHKEIDSSTGDTNPIVEVPSRVKHNLQFSVGVGVRLGSFRRDGVAASSTAAGGARPSEATRFEAGAHFTSLSFSPIRQLFSLPLIPGPSMTITELGFGGRFTFNLTQYLAVEAETNLLPRERGIAVGASGRVTQGQFGVKAGKRFRSFGVFGKARPGFVSFGKSFKQVGTQTVTFFGEQIVFGVFEIGRRTFYSTDVGGVLELYPSRRWVVRFDAGDTIIRYGERSIGTNTLHPAIIFAPPETRHNFQFTSGVAFRF
jgi:hypothetical protein